MSENELNALVSILQRASQGDDPSHDEIVSIRWKTNDPVIDEAANDAWVRLQHFAFDADTRGRDSEYDKQMRAELEWRATELEKLAIGENPFGRKRSVLGRLRRWFRIT